MSLHLPRRRFWRFTIYFICLVLVLLAADVLWARASRTIHPGYDTTRITAPVLDDGRIDYLAAVETYFSRGVTTENNAAPLLFQAYGREALPKTQPPDGITSRLGMPHLPEKGNYYVLLRDFSKSHGGQPAADNVELARPETWPAADSPATLDWLNANEKPLELIVDATQRLRLWIPFNGGNRPQILISVLLPHVRFFRDSGLALLTRARVRLHAGQLDGCREDLLAAHRLARLISQSQTLVERSFGYELERSACLADRQASSSGKLSAKQLRELLDGLASLPPLRPPDDAIDSGERYMMLDTTEFVAQLPPMQAGKLLRDITGHDDAPPYWLFPFLPVAYEQWMIAGNHYYDGLLAALRKPTYAQRRSALDELERTIDRDVHQNRLSVLSPSWPEGIFMLQLARLEQKWEAARAECRLSMAAAAIGAYKAGHGDYPATLSDLVPEYLKETPLDNFTDRPLIYSRAKSGYMLYSVGPNMTDDGGESTGEADDIVAAKK